MTSGREPSAIDVEAAYREWSQSYDEVENRTRDLDAVALRASGLDRAERDVVELGCGTGKNSIWLADGARSLVALDLSEEMLARARARVRAGNVRFVRHDLRTPWPLESRVADLVVANLVLEHIRDVGFIFAEAARVLRPAGELFISELHPFRQLLGSGAKLSDEPGSRIEAYVHDVGEYVNAAIAAAFVVSHLGEWRDPDTAGDRARFPRLLTIRLVAPR
jgi:SAM-dependent methyltransferase